MPGIVKRPPPPVPAWRKKLEEASGKKLTRAPQRRGRTPAVMLAVDCSASMDGDKIRQARRGALDFGHDAMARGYDVGVLKFASLSSTAVVIKPAAHLEPFRVSLEQLTPGGSTAMARAIELCAAQLTGRTGSVICIVTDGEPDSQKDTLAAARRARAMGIEIMVVGTDDADKHFLSQIVTRTQLATKVQRAALRSEIAGMAKRLPQLPPPSKKRLALPAASRLKLPIPPGKR